MVDVFIVGLFVVILFLCVWMVVILRQIDKDYAEVRRNLESSLRSLGASIDKPKK